MRAGHGDVECECTDYDRDDYPYSQSVEPRIAEALGGMWSPYDGTEFDSLRESHIEHIVALKEAHDSGLCRVSNATRSHFASDLENRTGRHEAPAQGQRHNPLDVSQYRLGGSKDYSRRCRADWVERFADEGGPSSPIGFQVDD